MADLNDVVTCACCHRVVFRAHTDGEGRCCNCTSLPPVERSDSARPEPEPRGVPRLLSKKVRP
jgi:hypothetical protein